MPIKLIRLFFAVCLLLLCAATHALADLDYTIGLWSFTGNEWRDELPEIVSAGLPADGQFFSPRLVAQNPGDNIEPLSASAKIDGQYNGGHRSTHWWLRSTEGNEVYFVANCLCSYDKNQMTLP